MEIDINDLTLHMSNAFWFSVCITLLVFCRAFLGILFKTKFLINIITVAAAYPIAYKVGQLFSIEIYDSLWIAYLLFVLIIFPIFFWLFERNNK